MHPATRHQDDENGNNDNRGGNEGQHNGAAAPRKCGGLKLNGDGVSYQITARLSP
jgi:hypothetical protein